MRSTSSKNRTRRAAKSAAALLAAALALALTGCGGNDNKSSDGGGSSGSSGSVKLPKLNGQTLEVAAVWTGAEQDNFMKVMDEFKKRTGAKVNFVPTGNNTS